MNLDVNTAKMYINLGYSSLSRTDACYLYRNLLSESMTKLKKLEPLIRDKSKMEDLLVQAKEAIKANLDYLHSSNSKFLREFDNTNELKQQYIEYCKEMNLLQSGLYHARMKIDKFIEPFEADLIKIDQAFENYESCRIQILVIQKELSELAEENAVLKRTISILSK